MIEDDDHPGPRTDLASAITYGVPAATETIERDLDTLVALDDPELFAWRRKALQHMANHADPALKVLFDQTSREIDERARQLRTGCP